MDTIEAASPLDKAISAAGGASALSRHLGITPQAVLQWKECPPNRVLEVERLTGISRHDLRPDIFGPALTSECSDETFPTPSEPQGEAA